MPVTGRQGPVDKGQQAGITCGKVVGPPQHRQNGLRGASKKHHPVRGAAEGLPRVAKCHDLYLIKTVGNSLSPFADTLPADIFPFLIPVKFVLHGC
jgi:hypothetical protein